MDETDPPPYDDNGPKSPAYDDAAEGRGVRLASDASDVVHPTILVLAGRMIYPETTGSAAVYELNHDVRYLSRADYKVEFARHEQRVRAARTTSHPRHIFNLESPPALVSTSPYAFFLTSVSRRTLGHVGLKKMASLPRPVFKVLMISRAGDDEDLFEITRRDGRYEWWDAGGRRVAIEDDASGQCKMILTTALQRQQADGQFN